MDRIGSAKRKRESPDEDEVAEILENVELTRKVLSQVCLPPSTSLSYTGCARSMSPLHGSWAWNAGC